MFIVPRSVVSLHFLVCCVYLFCHLGRVHSDLNLGLCEISNVVQCLRFALSVVPCFCMHTLIFVLAFVSLLPSFFALFCGLAVLWICTSPPSPLQVELKWVHRRQNPSELRSISLVTG